MFAETREFPVLFDRQNRAECDLSDGYGNASDFTGRRDISRSFIQTVKEPVPDWPKDQREGYAIRTGVGKNNQALVAGDDFRV